MSPSSPPLSSAPPSLLSSLTSSSPLPLLGPHLPTLLTSAALFTLTQLLVHLFAGRALLGPQWDRMDQRTRRGVASHTVSLLHAVVIIPLAWRALGSEILRRDPVFGYDRMVGNVLALSSGYFIWDTVDSMINSTIGFVVHGACCLAVYLFSFRPFLAGFGPPFLLWELSTPFLNIHWFMDKLGYSATHPRLFLVNALVFMTVFFFARILYGGYQSIAFFTVMYRERDRIPLHLHLIYCLGNLALTALNWLWFSKMLAKMLRRLSGKEKALAGAHRSRREEKRPLLEKQLVPGATSEEDQSAAEDEGGVAERAEKQRVRGSERKIEQK